MEVCKIIWKKCPKHTRDTSRESSNKNTIMVLENQERMEEFTKAQLTSKVELSMKVNGSMLCVMDMVSNTGLTHPAMKVCGEKAKLMDMESSTTLMVMCMKENGLMIKLMAKELTLMLMEQNMLDSGETINNMEMV